MERKKSNSLLFLGAIILIASIIFSVYARNTSYQQSVALGGQISELKEQIDAIEAGTLQGDAAALESHRLSLADQKLRLERPFSYGLIALFFSIILTLKGLYNSLVGQNDSRKMDLKRLTQAGLLAALCYIGFTFFKIDIPVGTEKTAFHLGNVFCVLASLFLGGYWGGLSGAVGMTIADLTTAYVTSAPKTFLLKFLIGVIVGLVAHNLCKLSRNHSAKYVTLVTILSSAAGMIFNIIADPIVGYFYKTYLLGIPQDLAATLAKLSLLTTSVNAIVAVICSSIFYLALRPALNKADLFVQVTPENNSKGNP